MCMHLAQKLPLLDLLERLQKFTRFQSKRSGKDAAPSAQQLQSCNWRVLICEEVRKKFKNEADLIKSPKAQVLTKKFLHYNEDVTSDFISFILTFLIFHPLIQDASILIL